MSSAVEAAGAPAPAKNLGMRKNGTLSPSSAFVSAQHLMLILYAGKQWHAPKKAFRPAAGLTSYEKRAKERQAHLAMKAKEKELKDEKEAERQVRSYTIDHLFLGDQLTLSIAASTNDQGQESSKGREREI